MEKLAIQLVVIVVFTALTMMPYQTTGQAHNPGPESDPTWAKTEADGKERTTLLQFYFHDNLTGDSVTAVTVVPAPGTNSFNGFGSIVMVDDPLTRGPDPSSKLVGRAQGLYGRASREDLTLIMALSLTFVDGIYNGSSISILTGNLISNPGIREFPVVGGTGVFRMARGYALAKTYFRYAALGNAIVAYNVTVVH